MLSAIPWCKICLQSLLCWLIFISKIINYHTRPPALSVEPSYKCSLSCVAPSQISLLYVPSQCPSLCCPLPNVHPMFIPSPMSLLVMNDPPYISKNKFQFLFACRPVGPVHWYREIGIGRDGQMRGEVRFFYAHTRGKKSPFPLTARTGGPRSRRPALSSIYP